jgi:hypothetical protein
VSIVIQNQLWRKSNSGSVAREATGDHKLELLCDDRFARVGAKLQHRRIEEQGMAQYNLIYTKALHDLIYTKALRAVGLGIGRPISVAASIQLSIAPAMLCAACS